MIMLLIYCYKIYISLGRWPGYALQSFFAEADKKRISVPIPNALVEVIFLKKCTSNRAK